VIKAKWGPRHKVFSQECGLKFSKKVYIFPEMGVSLKKLFIFYGALNWCSVSLGWAMGACPVCPL